MGEATATIAAGEGAGTTVPIGGGLTVGRDDDCGLVLADRDVAPHHLHLQPLPSGAVMLNELDLGRGTRVGDEEVTCAVLRGGEQVRLGATVLEVRTAGPPAPDARPLRPPATPSVIERVRLRRSVRRATLLAGVAVVTMAVAGIGLLTGLIGEDGPDIAAIVEGVAPSTVLVQAQRGDRRVGNGTGWVLDAPSGLLVTNAHVLNDGERFTVGVGATLRRASVVGVSPCEDLAVLRVADTAGLRSLPLGSQRTLRAGQTVVAVGFPGSASLSDALTSTVGVVSVARSEYRETALDVPRLTNVVQTDAAVNPGNSGGPLLALDGRLVGVTTAGRTLSETGRIIQGQGYAIGVDRAREVLGRLRTGASEGWWGLGFSYLSAGELRRRDLPTGLMVDAVTDGSAADRAGVAPGRLLLTAVDGRAVSNSLTGYCDAVAGVGATMPVRLSVVDIRSRASRDLIVR